MKILLVTPNFFPEKTGIGVTATDCARLISQLGHQVEVVAAMPHYPEWSIYEEYRGHIFVREKFEEMDVTRVWVHMPSKVTTKGRILFEVSMSIFSAAKTILANCDVMLAICPPLTVATTQAIAAALRQKPFWVYIQDIQPDAAICLGMLRNPLMIALSKWMEKFVYKRAEKILVLSEGMKQNLLKKGIAASKIFILPIAVDLQSLQKEKKPQSESIFRAQHALESKFIALYTGNIGVKQNPEILVECAKLLQDHKDIFFAIVGEGALREKIEESIAEHHLDNIRLLPLCSSRELLSDMLCSSDVLLLPQRKEVIDIVVPSKLITYMTSGTPVVASVHAESEAAKVIDQNNSGLIVAPENASALAAAILELKNNPKLASELGERGYQAVRQRYEYSIVRDRDYARLFERTNEASLSTSLDDTHEMSLT